MELTKCKLGELITQRREKNDGSDLPICGVSKDGLIPPKQKDADTSIYNVFYRDDFIFNPARMELNSIAINDMYDRAICSSLYEVFYVHRTDLLLPHYLELIIRQKWFTRYCKFLGQGSAREYCRFGNISEIEIEFPPIEEQQKIVEYNTAIENRIALKQKINDNLANTEQAILVETVINNHTVPTALGDLVDFIDGDRGKNYPTFDEFTSTGYCLFLNASNVTSTGFNFDNCMFVSEEKDKLMNKLNLSIEEASIYSNIGRQQHIHTEKQDYYIDLVFYNYILKCFVLIDLKTEKITHQDVGQMDMYIRMYDELKRSEGDNPTIGIVLCSDTDDDIARYSVMHGNEQLFASKYKLYLPTKEELKAEIETQKAMFYLQQQDNEDRNKNYTFNIE